MANTFDNANLNTFFDKLDTGATWSAGVAFKRAAALPLERYEVHKSYADALAYAQTNAVAYPGQVIAVVETEGTVEKIKIYFIDESKNLQEVGSATLGDDVTIVLDPATKKLSLKGFEDAGYVATKDTTPATDKEYFTVADGKYTKVAAPTGNPKESGYFERVAVKLIKDSAGNLAWVTDDAVQIQGDIASLQTTVIDHGKRITALETGLEEGLEDVNERISSLGTVFNYVGTLTVDEYASTTNNSVIDTSKNGVRLDRPYRLGDVILVGTQEYVVTQGEGTTLVWEAFGDPTGISKLESDVSGLKETTTGHTNAISTLNGAEGAAGSVKTIAKGYADTAEANAKGHADDLAAATKLITDDHADRLGKVETKASTNETSIRDINAAIGTDTTEGTIKKRIKDIEDTMALDSDLDNLATTVETLTGNVYNKGEADGKFATKTRVEEVATTAGTALTKAGANETAISGLQGSVSGLDTRLGTAEGTIGTHSGQISGLQGEVADLKDANGPIAKAQTTANEAKTAANNAQTTANTAVSDAAEADRKAVAAQGAADAAQGTANTAVANAATAQAAADAAQKAADAADDKAAAAGVAASNAQTTANEAKEKALANEAKFSGYYTKGEVDGKVGAIVTNGNDAASDDTIKGAKKYTDEKVATVNTAVNKLKEDIGNLTNVMNFVGKATEDPSAVTGNGAISVSGKTDKHVPEKGDVVVYGALEYVYVGSGTDEGWEIFGNVTADESRFDGIEDRLDSAEDRLDVAEGNIALLKDADAGFTTSVNDLSGRVTTLEGEMDAVEAELIRINPILEAAATKTALEAEVTRATDREDAIEKYAQEGFAAQLIVNNEIKQSVTNITHATDGLLAWGEF